MKIFYNSFFSGLIFLSVLLFSQHNTQAQCPYGIIPGSVAYDTTIATPPGINTLFVKFPQADPYDGMLTCLRLCISITGVVDSVSVENNAASPQVANVYYIRTDQITGPGLSAPLSNSINHLYGPYALGPTNGILGSGPDFVSISKDTVLNAVTTCSTINHPDSLFQFYGHDSVTYLYNITAFTNVTCTGGNYNSTVATSALVRFRFEYCTCPGLVLPLNVTNFSIEKIAENKASLVWTEIKSTETPGYFYEVEMSSGGKHFISLDKVNALNEVSIPYRFSYISKFKNSELLFFRIKQHYNNGYARFSEIRTVTLKNSDPPSFILYPNPANGTIGIKFDNKQNDKILIEIFNIKAQKVLSRELVVSGSYYQLANTLQKGMYWIRVTDVSSHLYSVNQLIIK